MSCNRCAATAEAVAPSAGAGNIEANWADHRAHPQQCDKCGGFLRADGGCTQCETGTTVTSDGDSSATNETLLAMAGTPPKQSGADLDNVNLWMLLSCGHKMATSVSPGSEEWCTRCDDFAAVEKPAVGADTARVETILFSPPDEWGPGRVQLWGMLEQEAQKLGITKVVRQWTGFAHSPAGSKAIGKVDGFFYGETADGVWYFVTANGPVGIARIRKTTQCMNGEVEAEALFFGRSGKKKREFDFIWPCDGSGKGIFKCHTCDAIISAGSACYNCYPQAARADAEKAVNGDWY